MRQKSAGQRRCTPGAAAQRSCHRLITPRPLALRQLENHFRKLGDVGWERNLPASSLSIRSLPMKQGKTWRGTRLDLTACSRAVVVSAHFLSFSTKSGVGVLGWTAPDGIDCARMRSLQISNKGDRPWNRLAGLAWTRRKIFSSFTG